MVVLLGYKKQRKFRTAAIWKFPPFVKIDNSMQFVNDFFVREDLLLGNVNNDKGFILTKDTNSPDVIDVGTTELDFTQFSGAGQIVAGNGLTKQ